MKRVLLATSGNINLQDPFPKPGTELQDSAKSGHRCVAALLSLIGVSGEANCSSALRALVSRQPGPAGAALCRAVFAQPTPSQHLLRTQPVHLIAKVAP